MTDATQQFHALLFVDFTGTSELYDHLGDRSARETINELLTRMTGVTKRYSGVLVRTLDDEMLCRFPTAERCIKAAISMQEELANNMTLPVPMQMRMGLHWGPITIEKGDVFGEAVSVAARLSSIAKPGQILTSKDTLLSLPKIMLNKTRPLQTRTPTDMSLYEVLWDEENNEVLHLRYQDQQIDMPKEHFLKIGRDAICDIVMDSSLASRLHAKIENRHGKFIFIDQSTNGSYVRTEDGNVSYLLREEIALWGTGVISLGKNFDSNKSHWIYFSNHTEA